MKYALKIENLEVFTTLYSKSENSNTKGYLLLMSGGSCDDPSFLKHDVWCLICTSKVQNSNLKRNLNSDT